MRRIDADELKKVICNNYDCEIGLYSLLDLINNAPTVPPEYFPPCEDCNKKMEAIRKAYDKMKAMERPHGKWIKEDDEHLKGWYRCSECGRRVEDLTDDIKIHAGGEDYTIADLYPYCHCGAKMEGGAE